jgi:hypothetical protein
MPVIPVTGEAGQEDCNFKASLGKGSSEILPEKQSKNKKGLGTQLKW